MALRVDAEGNRWTKSPIRPAKLTAVKGRIRAARFPSRKSLEEFDFDHQRSLERDTIIHLGTLDFITARENVVFLGPPGTDKTTCRSDCPSTPATASRSAPPPNGLPTWLRPSPPENCRQS